MKRYLICFLLTTTAFQWGFSEDIRKHPKPPKLLPAQEGTAQQGLYLMKGWEFLIVEYGNKKIIGRVKNDSNKKYSYVQITFSVYDKDKAKLGTTSAVINNLEPGEVWKFEAPVFQEDAYTVRSDDLQGF